MGKTKLFNDPIYGLIDLRYDILYDIIDEPYFQRLRRIKQMGMSDFVYPGATHTRFQHAIGATYLLQETLDSLEQKGIEITYEEKIATSIAILCHDIGHGPFSHALERKIVNISHEEITKLYLQHIAKKYGNIIELTIKIFNGDYEKKFLHQLISSQLDVDRLDYLSRDSFYSGVAEGVIGYDRIIKMMNVYNNEIVVEEKGIFSIEKFLTSRYLMYMQVYLHKTSLASEKMLENLITFIKEQLTENKKFQLTYSLEYLLKNVNVLADKEEFIHHFSLLDDTDVWYLIKNNTEHEEKIVKFLSNSLLRRKLFKVHLQSKFHNVDIFQKLKNDLSLMFSEKEKEFLIYKGSYLVEKYSNESEEIMILTKDNLIKRFSEFSLHNNDYTNFNPSQLNYFIYPKEY